MAHPLDSAKLKVEWAKRHIPDLERMIHAFFKTKPYAVAKEPEPDGKNETYKVRITKTVPGDIALMAGNIIHNLRSSLDYATCRLAEANGAVNIEHVSFPFGKDFDAFESSAKDKIKKLTPAARAFIYGLKPYGGANGNALLWSLHYLNLGDKHRELLAIGSQGAMSSARIDYIEDGVLYGHHWQSLEDGVKLITVRKGSHYKGQIEFVCNVSFGKVEILKREPAVAALNQLAGMTEGILVDIERTFF